jgi:transposase-like protein
MDHSVGGWKPSQYSERMASIILARIKRGETVNQLLADPDMPSRRTLYDWIAQHPGFGAAWTLMRSEMAADRRRRIIEGAQGGRERGAPHPRADGGGLRQKAGRKSTYTLERGRAVCALVERGFTTGEAARRSGLANVAILHRWLRNHADFRTLYIAAAKAREDRLAFAVLVFVSRVDVSCLDRLDIANFMKVKKRVERLERRMAATRPYVWRWD